MTMIVPQVFRIDRDRNHYSITCSLPIDTNKIERIVLKAISIPSLDTVSDFRYYAELIEKQTDWRCCDVLPINGHQTSRQNQFLKNLIRPKNVKELNDQLTYLTRHFSSGRTNLFVLDITDAQGLYANKSEIEKAETIVASFLQQSEPKKKSPRKDFHQSVTNHGIEFFLNEGSLKHDILNQLPSDCVDFLQKTDRGRDQLCQLCEIIMNFFKIGFLVEVQSQVLHPQNYFASTSIRSKGPNTKLVLERIHNISLATLYPSHYREMYAMRGEYYSTITEIFETHHQYDEITQITAITIKNKKEG